MHVSENYLPEVCGIGNILAPSDWIQLLCSLVVTYASQAKRIEFKFRVRRQISTSDELYLVRCSSPMLPECKVSQRIWVFLARFVVLWIDCQNWKISLLSEIGQNDTVTLTIKNSSSSEAIDSYVHHNTKPPHGLKTNSLVLLLNKRFTHSLIDQGNRLRIIGFGFPFRIQVSRLYTADNVQ